MAKLGDFMLDVLFPKRCFWCNEVIGFGSCKTCESSISRILLPDGDAKEKQRHIAAVDICEIYACYEYKRPVDNAIMRMKYGKEKETAKEFGRLLADKYQSCVAGSGFDLVIPVPVSEKTYKHRGFNQSYIMAKELCNICNIRLESNLLVKHKETQQQAGLARRQRLENVKGAYKVFGAELLKGKSVLLVDDVVTTGSTINECAKVILESGASNCGALCLAST